MGNLNCYFGGSCFRDERRNIHLKSRKSPTSWARITHFWPHNRVHPINDSEEAPTEAVLEDLPSDRAEKAPPTPKADGTNNDDSTCVGTTPLLMRNLADADEEAPPADLLEDLPNDRTEGEIPLTPKEDATAGENSPPEDSLKDRAEEEASPISKVVSVESENECILESIYDSENECSTGQMLESTYSSQDEDATDYYFESNEESDQESTSLHMSRYSLLLLREALGSAVSKEDDMEEET
ncbi:unnamed protein product [Rangifer tarandus platyrhynchus]|uniref:Uncharacterized protein n=2 Tax=Rangifer tarandus platyrhynchus TaxID=3082113 RepID=A0ACB0FMI5_RANTA|nr:unnamed protein product [Rangifer tarandus platyrhynchus]CAI9713829.1 unnamed protein product [Rangifer tarandus platyrhynchus]